MIKGGIIQKIGQIEKTEGREERECLQEQNTPGIGTGLEDLDICRGEVPEPVATTEGPEGPTPTALGLDDRDKRLGVAGGVRGGVAPLPLALDSPMAFTRSFTDTPCSSGGTSLGMLEKKVLIIFSC